MNKLPSIIITTGEPAGIGPDIVLQAACMPTQAHLVAVGNRQVLAARAQMLGLDIILEPYSSSLKPEHRERGRLFFIDIPVDTECTPGKLAATNTGYVLAQLDLAIEACISREFDALVTAPIHKGVINDGGVPFSGHTEYLAESTGSKRAVMLLAAEDFRVALATTHLPLSAVPKALSWESIEDTLKILHVALIEQFAILEPRITVLGLNPHAGEWGHLGHEETEFIQPVCAKLRAQGMRITGPVSADTAFVPARRAQTDVYLAMYHDQVLPVLKTIGFHAAVNVTLGLPIIRVSVDHGTALELAGTGRADPSSLCAAIEMASQIALCSNQELQNDP
jgi:4-hydroxythreonine-4-phosphate dehydrogenase